MSKTKQLLKSFYHFKMLAAFRIQPVGKSIGYLFYLSLIVLIPVLISSIYTYLTAQDALSNTISQGISSGIFVVIFLPFIYFFIAVSLFLLVSALAGLAVPYARYRRMRADYKQLWNISAFAVTAPTVVLVCMESFIISSPLLIYLYFLISCFYVLYALSYLPKQPK
ncbi:DUF1189 domain-containing protein [Halobacillus shinanisalinarum]|uniref:DUF1189 domain-containing protein n=1 Tax=Halobacillus shinanisalinarum TaxID=2932258 RepID=A0ABY4H298_9BACI|nr:DUF1189 family protein [Halobacillus shinanisalinarum]UOQ93752.1 DUF1189 domain-containing protein [Halobacillus shinanisalinarum]